MPADRSTDALLRFLKQKGVTAKELGAIIGRDRSLGQLILTGKRGVRDIHLPKIAAYFGVPIADLFKEEEPAAEPPPNVLRTSAERDLIEHFRLIADERVQLIAIDLVKRYARDFGNPRRRKRFARQLAEDPPHEPAISGRQT